MQLIHFKNFQSNSGADESARPQRLADKDIIRLRAADTLLGSAGKARVCRKKQTYGFFRIADRLRQNNESGLRKSHASFATKEAAGRADPPRGE